MGIINTKELRRIDEATSNSSLSNLRYVITEKPKWKVFKKKEVVPLQPYRSAKGCPCGNDGPCKQKVTPKGVTIHYPQKKKKFGTFGYKLPKLQKNYFSRLAWKAFSSALPFQTKINANINISVPLGPIYKVSNAYKAVKSMKVNLPSVRNKIKSLKSKKKPVKRSVMSIALATGMSSNEDQTTVRRSRRGFENGRFSFGTGGDSPAMEAKFDSNIAPTVVNKVKLIKQRKFPTWRLDQISCDSPFCRNYGRSHCSIVDKSKWKVRELVSNDLLWPSIIGMRFDGSLVNAPPPPPSAPPATVVNQESVSPN